MVSNKLYQENTLIIGCSVLVALCASCFTIVLKLPGMLGYTIELFYALATRKLISWVCGADTVQHITFYCICFKSALAS